MEAREAAMLKTPLCSLLGIDVPIILAPMGTCTSGEFAAAVSNNGGLGGVGSLFRTAAAIKRDIDAVRKLTTRPFALNHIPQNLVPEAFDYATAARPAAMSFALADPGDLARRARDVGARIMVQVTTVAQAVQAAERGADIIIARGGEAGGYAGEVSTMALVPQVVDAVAPIPVVAAGGIFDGRGIAAALMLGAAGVNLGTRFIACRESPAPDEWKQAIVRAKSEDVMRAEVLNEIVPCLAPRASALCCARSTQHSSITGAPLAKKRGESANGSRRRSFQRRKRAGHMQHCSPPDRASAASRISRASPN
jgi:enoyl-[acyl-carrier protein] reductase II